jgi:hypothetical protein
MTESRALLNGDGRRQPRTPPGSSAARKGAPPSVTHGALASAATVVTGPCFAAIGQTEELKPHLRGALNLGWTADELREALLQTSGYAGFPAAHEALRVLSGIVTPR